jgi:acetylornithine/succinyldiaminopimelate/putrescine aminotransferase
MDAMMATAAVGQSMEKDGTYYSIYGWHPRSTAAAIASIRYMRKHQRTLLANVEGMSRYFRARLSAMEFQAKPQLHIWGLAIGVDVGTERYASRLQEDARREGLFFSVEGSTIVLHPALNIEHAVAEKGLDILQRCARG